MSPARPGNAADLLFRDGSQWNQPSIDFYEKTLNASAMSEWMGMRLEEKTGGIDALKRFARS